MRFSIKTAISAVAFMALSSAPALAQIATFDDIPSTGATPVPFGYAVPGMSWYNWYVTPASFTGTGGACDVSQFNCGFNGSGSINSLFESATPFDFDSGYFMAWYNTTTGGFGADVTLTVNGWLGGVLVGSNTFTLNGSTPQLLTFNYDNVNLVTFDTHANDGNWYLADNLVFNDATAVPEPASLTLLATGMVGVFGLARRRWHNGSTPNQAA